MGTSALACGGGASTDGQSPEQTSTTESVSAAEPLPAEEAIPADDGAQDTPVDPTDEEKGSAPVEGSEGTDPGFAAVLAENPAPADQDLADENDGVGTKGEALTTSARGATLNTEAKRIAGFTDRATSYYSSTTYMNESTGTRRTDCTGLMSYILARKQSSAYKLIPSSGVAHPLSKDFYDYFISRPTTANTGTSPRWRRVIRPKYLSPGDIIVYKYTSTSSTGTTGHTMMVTGYPTQGRSGELLVRVVDSARSGHANDTRGSSYSGPGTGILGIKVDSTGLPVGYYWRGGVSTTLNTTRLAFGHLE